MNTHQKLILSLQSHTIQFHTTQTTFFISSESNDHTKRWTGEFTSDLIQQLSNDLIETIQDMMDYITSNQKEEIFSMNEEGLKIVFKYVINKKDKIKEIVFPLEGQKIDDITAIKMENNELKQKVSNLNAQLQSLKISSQEKYNALSQQIQDLKASFEAKINESNTNLQTKIQNGKNVLRTQFNQIRSNLDSKIDSKSSFGDISVREIKFQNGWVLGYNTNKAWFGFVCNPNNVGYWMKQTAEQKYL